MEGNNNGNLIINPPDYMEAIQAGKEFYLQFYHPAPEVESSLIKTLHRFLEHYDILYLKEMLVTVLKELINNAVKANMKRIYFEEKGLQIDDTGDYRKGMESFKEETFGPEEIDFEKLAQHKLIIRVLFRTTSDRLIIHVINNVPILDEELSKIDARIKKAYKYEDISEAFDDVLDDSEGAGLGLIMALMLFKNIGLPQESFRVTRKNNLTVSIINIPQMLNRSEIHLKLTEEISRELDNIPSFPENIREIQRLCANPESTIKAIADSIKKDPGLTTSILKIANSAGYMTINKVETIEDAVKKIGLKGINALLVASGVQKVIDARYKKFETIWKNSYKTAFYAQKISMQVNRLKLGEYVYLAALLSDIGRIILLSIKPEMFARIKELAGRKGMQEISLLEEISLGISHSTLGSMVLKKWNFNEAMVFAVEYHLRPHMAPEKYRELIYIIYLATVLTEYEDRKFRFDTVDEDVLEHFQLNTPEKLGELYNRLKAEYEEHLAGKVQ